MVSKKQAASAAGSVATGTNKRTKRTLKFLASQPSSRIVGEVLAKPSAAMVKSICNACANVAFGEGVSLDPREKLLCARGGRLVRALVEPRRSLHYKKRLISSIYSRKKNSGSSSQNGGFFPLPLLGTIAASFIPSLLQTVFSKIGSGFVVEH